MEFEIINDILTSTVSKLFPNITRHLNYFRFEDDSNTNNTKSDIPKSSHKKEEFTNINNVFNSNKKETSFKDSNRDREVNINNIYDNWKNFESAKRLDEALKRLNVDEAKCKNKNLVNLAMDYLLAEKTKVKSELKKFDNDFYESFQRFPNRNEKEVMRIIYLYYKNLKQAITHKQSNKEVNEKEKETEIIKNNNFVNKTNDELTKNTNSFGHNNLYLGSNTSSNINTTAAGNLLSSKITKEVIITKKDNSQVEYTNTINNNKSAISSKPNDQISFNNFDFTSSSKKTTTSKDKKLTKMDLLEIEKEYDIIKQEQIDLKQKLHTYQKDFYEIHNRRVKYYKDIIGVEEEYQKYKDNKIRMKEVQDLLLQYKKDKQNKK